jgi:hypothetical protein
VVGTLLARTDSTLTVVEEKTNALVVIPLSTITAIDQSRGRHGNAGSGAVYGLFAGTAVGIGAALIVCSGGNCGQGSKETDYSYATVLGLGLGGALVGTGLGALIGSQTHSEKWSSVPLSGIRVGILPDHAGLRIGASVALRF